jgi:Bacterial membrane protein YfhO
MQGVWSRVSASVADRTRDWICRHEYLAVTLGLAVVLLVYFWPLLIGHQLGQSHQLYSSWPWKGEVPADLMTSVRSGEGDAASQFQPLLSVAHHQLAGGELPLWNPYTFAGAPLLADMQSALLYPLTWLALILPVPVAWGWIALLKLLTAGVGAYALGRHLRLGRGAALVASLVYMLSAPGVAWLQWPLGTVFSLFPWLLLATDRVYRRPTGSRVAAVAVVVALSIFAGHPETALLSSLAAAVYLLALVAADRGQRGGAREVARRLGAWAGGQLLGLLLSAVALLPFLDAYSRSITREVHGVFATLHLPFEGTLLWLTPNAFGDGRPEYQGPLGTYVTTAAYFGIAAILLAGVAGFRRRRRPRVLALAAMALVALMVVFAIPPVSWIVRNAPGLSSGNNVRVLYVVALVGALGAGAGVDALLARRMTVRSALLAAAGLLIVVQAVVGIADLAGRLHGPHGLAVHALLRADVFIALGFVCLLALGRLPRPAALVLVMVVVVADLGYMQPYNAVLPPHQAYPPTPPSIAFLQRQPGLFHISSVGQGFFPPYILQPDTAAEYRLEDIRGYEYPLSKRWSDFSAMVLGERGLTRELILFSPRASGAGLTAQRLMNVRFYVGAPTAAPPQPEFRTVYRGRDLAVFEDPLALPRAYVVGRVGVADDRAALATLSSGELDPRLEALVPPGAPLAPAPAGPMQPVSVRELDAEHVRIDVTAGSRGGWLVLASAFNPDWRASVDGASRKVYPTDFAAMGLPLSPGAHVVQFSLSRSHFWAASALSGLGVLLMLVLIVPRRRRSG